MTYSEQGRCQLRSRSPRRQRLPKHAADHEKRSGNQHCRFCGSRSICEFGKDLSYCSSACYTHARKGEEALDWYASDANCWLQEEGLSRWRRQLASLLGDGRAVLTKLTEGALRRIGVPRHKAKEVMLDVEDLRRGAWAQPEPPRKELPLMTVAELGRKAGKKNWELVLEDNERRSYASLCRAAVPADAAWTWFQQLYTLLPWQDLSDERYQTEGKMIPRRTIFTVAAGCSCIYKYSGVKVTPTVEPDFVAHIRKTCVEIAGLKEQPNSCNINLYRSGHDSVGWHTDDEELFEGDYNDITILSLSLGATRSFQVKRKPAPGSGPNAGRRGPAEITFACGHGDLCTMEGRFQRYYLHSVPKELDVTQPRINLTWRWITKHNQMDGCPLHGPGN